MALLSNGDASVDYNLVINSSKPYANVTLFGRTQQNLTLDNYNDTKIKYTRTEQADKITVYSPDTSIIHVTYITPDFVDKQNRNWTFSFFFPDRFLLKIPEDAHIIHMEPPPFLTPTTQRNLWGFGPGNVQVKYIMGPLGSLEEARASILSIEDALGEAQINYNDIVLTVPVNLLEQARNTFKDGNYFETVTYAEKANDLLKKAEEDYVSGLTTISQAEGELQRKQTEGYDTSNAEVALLKARTLFSEGEYEKAKNTATYAASQVTPKSESLLLRIGNIFIAFIFVGASLVILAVLRKRGYLVYGVAVKKYLQGIRASEFAESLNLSAYTNPSEKDELSPSHSNTSNTKAQKGSSKDLRASSHESTVVVPYEEPNRSPIRVPSPSPYATSTAIGKAMLAQVIAEMKSERPYLRVEDKQLLDYLLEKEGSAFESEIRNEFVLPRTSLWRLVKRLEREDLVEVRKIGGQNLIKLRFEDKS